MLYLQVIRETGVELHLLPASSRSVQTAPLLLCKDLSPNDSISFRNVPTSVSSTSVHLSDALDNFKHHQVLAGRLKELEAILNGRLMADSEVKELKSLINQLQVMC